MRTMSGPEYRRARRSYENQESWQNNLQDKIQAESLARILHMAIGLCGESGELINELKKNVYGKNVDIEALALELGDILWYLDGAAEALGYTLGQLADMNIAKLEARHVDGRSVVRYYGNET